MVIGLVSLIGAFCVALSASAMAGPQASELPLGDSEASDQGRYIVVLEDSVRHPGAVAEAQSDEVESDVSLVFRSAIKGYAATMPSDQVEALEEDPRVAYVTPDRKLHAFAQQVPTGVKRIGALANEAIAINSKDDLRVDADVAIIDTGVDSQHPDLNLVERVDCVPIFEGVETECIEGRGKDPRGHGTHVAGIVGALDNGIGTTGVAPGARLWAVRVLGPTGSGFDSWVIAGVDWVTAHSQQIEVANMSLGGKGTSPPMEEAIEASQEAGVVYVIAAGNASENAANTSPARIPSVITVSALADYDGQSGGKAAFTCSNRGLDDRLANFSNYGSVIDVAAPGACIESTLPVEGSTIGEGYGTISGTSMASPHVAGAAAILASQSNPSDFEDVDAIGDQIKAAGSSAWTDTSGDGVKEPLLDTPKASFDPADQGAATGAATVSSETEATVAGMLNPAGLSTQYRFEYGTTQAYGTLVPIPNATATGTEYTAVSKALKGLSPETLYHYRLTAINANGTFHGNDRILGTTKPVVKAKAAAAVGAESAELQAEIDPQSLPVNYYFEFGTTTEYGEETGSSKGAGGSSLAPVSALVSGLTGGVTYHYRVVAEGLAGTVKGEDQTFTTDPLIWAEEAAPDLVPEDEDLLYESRPMDVSCLSASFCMSVGSAGIEGDGSPISGKVHPISHLWDGEDWSLVEMPNKLTEGTRQDELHSVSCSSPSWCVAAGASDAPQEALLEAWDGSKWSVMTQPSGFNLMGDVSCVSSVNCVAVGTRFAEDGTHALALQWNGTKWTQMATVDFPGAIRNTLSSISCPSAELCVAAGFHLDEAELQGEYFPTLIQRYDGKEWSLVNEDVGGPMESMSCTAEPDLWCLATVNLSQESNLFGIASFEGSGWSLEKELPVPPGATAGSSRDVSCAAERDCVVVGTYVGGPVRERPLVRHRGSAGWTIQSSVGLTNSEIGNRNSELNGVSCLKSGECVAVGGKEAGAVPALGLNLASLVQRRTGAPAVSTDPASRVKPSRVNLRGTVNPRGKATTYWFEYGKTTAYGTKLPVSPKSAGSGSVDVEVEELLSGLDEGTTYHYRLVASSAVGTAYGSDQTVTTSPPFFAVGSTGSGPGQFKAILGMAVDADDHVWVADSENHRVQELGPNGEFLSEFGEEGTVPGKFQYPGGIAVDSGGDIWVVDVENQRVQQFNQAGEYLSGFGGPGAGNGQFSEPLDIAIDSAGYIWVADAGNSRLQKFNQAGQYLSKFGNLGTTYRPSAVAIDSEDHLWVADYYDRVEQYDQTGKLLSYFGKSGLSEENPKADPGTFLGTWGIEVDSEDRIWVPDEGNNRVQVFNQAGQYLDEFGEKGSGTWQIEGPTIVAINDGSLWVSDAQNRIAVWSEPQAHTAVTDPAEVKVTWPDGGGLPTTSTQLNGTVDPNGGSTSYWFEYGKTTAYGTKLPVSPKLAGSGTKAIAVSETIAGLPLDTTYHYRLVAKRGAKTVNGEDMTLSTLNPTVSDGIGKNVTRTDATLVGKVNPRSKATTYWFEYGSTTALGSKQPVTPKSAGSGNSNVEVSEALTGLTSGKVHFARLVASNGGVITYGAKFAFGTYRNAINFGLSKGSTGSGNGQFSAAKDVALRSNGDVFVLDSGNSRVQRFNYKGEYVLKFGSKGTGNGQFEAPRSIAVDDGANTYVLDTGNNRVQKFNTSGEFVLKFGSKGTGNGQFESPLGIAHYGEYLYVADTGNNRIQKFNTKGEYLSKFGSAGSGNGQFSSPRGVAVSTTGTSMEGIYVADTGNNRIQKFDSSGAYVTKFGSKGTGNGQFETPVDVSVSRMGLSQEGPPWAPGVISVWVADSLNRRVQQFNPWGQYVAQIGSKGSGSGQFESIAGIGANTNEFITADRIWVIDDVLNRMQSWGT